MFPCPKRKNISLCKGKIHSFIYLFLNSKNCFLLFIAYMDVHYGNICTDIYHQLAAISNLYQYPEGLETSFNLFFLKWKQRYSGCCTPHPKSIYAGVPYAHVKQTALLGSFQSWNLLILLLQNLSAKHCNCLTLQKINKRHTPLPSLVVLC